MFTTGDHQPCVPPDWYYRPCLTDAQLDDEGYAWWAGWWFSWYGALFWGGWNFLWGSGAWGYFFDSSFENNRCAGWQGLSAYGWGNVAQGGGLLPINKWSSSRWSWVKAPLELRYTDPDDFADWQWQLACFPKDYECSAAADPEETDPDAYSFPFIPWELFYARVKRFFLKCDDPYPVEQRADYDASVWDLWWNFWNWWGNDGSLCEGWWSYFSTTNAYARTPIGGHAGLWSGAFYVCAPFKIHFNLQGRLHALGQILRVTVATSCLRDPDNANAPYEYWSRTAIVYGKLKPDTGTLTPCGTCRRIRFNLDWTVALDEFMIWRKHRPWAVSEPLLVTVEVVGQFWPEDGGVTVTTEIESPDDSDTDGDGVDDALDEDDTNDDWGGDNDPDIIDEFPILIEGEDGDNEDGEDGNPDIEFPTEDPDDTPPAPIQPPVQTPPPPTPPDDASNPCCCHHALGADGVYHGAATLTVAGFAPQIGCYQFVDPSYTFSHTYGNLDGRYNCVADCATGWDLVANLGQQGNATRRGVLVETWFKAGDPDFPKQVYCYKISTSPNCGVCPTDATLVQLEGGDVTFEFHIFDSAGNYEGDPTAIVATTEHRLSACKALACDGTLVDFAPDVAIIPLTQICDPDCTAAGTHPCTVDLLFEINLNVSP